MSAEPIRVLLIDDDDAHAGLIRTRLGEVRAPRVQVSCLATPEHALEALSTQRPDVVLFNFTASHPLCLDGLRLLVTSAHGMPVIAISHAEDDALALDAVRCGAQDCLPDDLLNGRRLVRAIRHAIARTRALGAYHDVLTGLPNRALFGDFLRQSIARAKRNLERRYAVLSIDIDRFKVVNESLGHDAGDRLLMMIARRLEACLRPEDSVARLSGDEFAVLLDGIGSGNDTIRVADRIQKTLTRPFTIGDMDAFASASIGIALGTHRYTEPAEVLRDASIAMYRAKMAGRARHAIFDQRMHAQAVRLMSLETDLRRAVQRRELEVYYQPIVAFGERTIGGLEALVRWRHPERGLLGPRDFIPLAEETGLIVPLGRYVLTEACRQMQEWTSTLPGRDELVVNVNVSARQLLEAGLAGEVETILHDTDLAPKCLRLEMTESVIMRNAASTRHTLTRLRDLGVRLAIDDFGTGYSSLSYLHRFPVDTLKIDRTFVGNLFGPRENVEIVKSIVSIAKNLGLDVTAEGVETEGQVRLLTDADCHTGQGFLFHPPLAACEAGQVLMQS